ncbi:MAG: UbiA family prenyltransferase [Deltaproteobacteria bacterium]|nr:UbiA family prenyltransferase [Deltaproteobacteria bacterium]MBW2253139.1 UbiA family prenyltransferase [Deltaproteobacteria bacterium]
MGPDAPWSRRFVGWLRERFPPVVYTILVVLFHGSAVLVAHAFGGGDRLALAAVVVVWLFFLHLRIFDEHKDYAEDIVAYPGRLLSRGVVTLPLLARVGAVAIVVQAVLAALLGRWAFLAWAAAALFSVAMRYEFGVGRWLNRHIVLYAVTHNPVVAGLAVFLYAAAGARWDWAYLWYVGVASLGSLAFEFGRKTRRSEEEHAGVPSYTTELGQGPARALLGATYVATWGCVSGLFYALGVRDPWPVVLGLAVVLPGLLTVPGHQPAKRVELGASLVLLVSFLVCGTVAWGVSWSP